MTAVNGYTAAPAPSAIDPSWTINELLRREPSSAPVLNAFGVDTCCGGGDTITEAAANAGLDAAELIGALSDALTHRIGATR
jgi:regulator of cell morphogenesis and NO signaling